MDSTKSKTSIDTVHDRINMIAIYFGCSRIYVLNSILILYNTIMELETAALQLEALGNPTRLEIFRNLMKTGPQGSSVGAIRESLDIPGSTLSHHIAKLVSAGLLTQQRDSRTLVCKVENESMDDLMEFLVHNCCTEDWIIQDE
jgi:DNA-binding transcriptional ArsR family regulator